MKKTFDEIITVLAWQPQALSHGHFSNDSKSCDTEEELLS